MVDSAAFEAGPQVEDASAPQAIESCEGLLAIVNASHGAARIQEQLAPWAGSLKDSSAELKLLIATHSDRLIEAEQDKLHSALVLWALDHGFEFVQADATNPVEGGSDREKEGLPRVWEAMQSVMWSSMQMHPPGGAASGVGTTASVAGAAATLPAADADAPPSGSDASGGDTPSPSRSETDAAAPTAALHSGAVGDAAAETVSQTPEAPASGFEESEDGPGSDEFESMLAQVAAVRAANQQEGVTDEQRRQNAADMALKLLSAFGLGDSEEDLEGVLGGGQ